MLLTKHYRELGGRTKPKNRWLRPLLAGLQPSPDLLSHLFLGRIPVDREYTGRGIKPLFLAMSQLLTAAAIV